MFKNSWTSISYQPSGILLRGVWWGWRYSHWKEKKRKLDFALQLLLAADFQTNNTLICGMHRRIMRQVQDPFLVILINASKLCSCFNQNQNECSVSDQFCAVFLFLGDFCNILSVIPCYMAESISCLLVKRPVNYPELRSQLECATQLSHLQNFWLQHISFSAHKSY